jgi:hypothetical protein
MNARGTMRKSKNMAALSAAVAAFGFANLAKGQTVQLPFGSAYATNASEIETTGPFQSAIGGIPYQFTPGTGSGASFQGWSVFDFNTSNIPLAANTDIGAVGSDITLNMWDDVFSSDIATNATLFFYLVTDNTTQINIPATASPLRYLKTTVAQTATFSGGLNGPGLTGGFAAGSTYYPLLAASGSNGSGILNGTAIYNNTLATNNSGSFDFVYSLTLPSAAAETYVQQQVNSGGNLRIVVTTNSTAGGTASEYSYLGPGTTDSFVNSSGNIVSAIPTVSLDLTTAALSNGNNNSTLTLAPTSIGYEDGKDASVNLGRVLQGTNQTVTLTLDNTGTDPGLYREQIINFANASSPGADPVSGGGTSTIVVGLSPADTAFGAGQNPNGQDIISNVSNPNDGNITINVQATPVAVRFVDALSGTLTPNYGKVLVGTTATMNVPLQTVNPVLGDFSSNSLEVETLIANSPVTAFAPKDLFNTGVALANIGGEAPAFNQVFAGGPGGNVPEVGDYYIGTLAIEHSGVYAPTVALNVLGTTKTYGNNDAEFENTGGTQNVVKDELLSGEPYTTDSIFLYAQWQGYQTASLAATPTVSSPLTPGGAGTITNVLSNDNIFSTVQLGVTNTYNMGIRAQAWVTTVSFNQTGVWSQTGLTPVTISGTGAAAMATSGSVIIAQNNSLANIAANSGATASFTLGTLSTTGNLNGTYTATMSVYSENEQDITGAGVNDLPVTNFSLMGSISYSGGLGAGSYSLTGGGLTVEPDVILSGSFTQTGGTSTFPQLNGNGSVNISGPSSLTVGGGGVFTGSIINNGALTIIGDPTVVGNISGGGSLAIAGTGTVQFGSNSHTISQSGLTIASTAVLDISNNTVAINFGAPANDPINALVTALSQGYNSGAWTGAANPGTSGAIVSSTAAIGAPGGKPVLSIGYADGDIDNGTGNTTQASATAGQVLVKMTLAGDAFLVGTVNFNDLDVVGKHLNTSGNDWASGNFNYDPAGAVNFNDLDIVGQNLNTDLGALGSQGVEFGGTILPVGQVATVQTQNTAATPEPGSLALTAIGAAGLLKRRRAKRRKPTG